MNENSNSASKVADSQDSALLSMSFSDNFQHNNVIDPLLLYMQYVQMYIYSVVLIHHPRS